MSGNYAFEIAVPLATTQANAVETELILSGGIIDEIAIGFPPGCSALARVQLLYENVIIFPSNPDNSYAWDNVIIEFNPRYDLPEINPILVARCWNLDEFYAHTITFMINVVEKNVGEVSLNGFLSIMSRN